MNPGRTKVRIYCRQCGERFILKGKREKGRVETGFRQCLCSNEHDFEIEYEDY
ncbi:MAG: hypothetical protein K0R57_3276 [Paenibacillaceae bacterium]|nr:hypothetical protein [Paenibacillaceae bacterium]